MSKVTIRSIPFVLVAASYNRHKILEIDDSVGKQLILILEDAFNPAAQRKAIVKAGGDTVFIVFLMPMMIYNIVLFSFLPNSSQQNCSWKSDLKKVVLCVGKLQIINENLKTGE